MAFQKFKPQRKDTDWGARKRDKSKSQWRKRQRQAKEFRKSV